MSKFSIEDLNRLLASGATAGGDSEITDSSLAEEFTELGYDSLALLELVSKVEREYGLKLPEDALENMLTPRSTVDYISARLAEKEEAQA
ncbi:acyl carrier protein [Saccharomonospora sp.]|uniref:acyl carrier protein n=1 Tax=Saccharomonospora sp. TaxID=33913 RepID=UPI0026205BE1|nr:acyl carrier protein [Saccharomonospora sp.]